MKTKPVVHLKTSLGYFTIYGWNYRADSNKTRALPFPNPLSITLATARKWLKQEKIAEIGTEIA